MATQLSFIDVPAGPLRPVLAELVEESRRTRREIMARAGLSKDQLCRTLRGSRPLDIGEAAAILSAADLPARGVLTLALFDRPDLAVAWTRSGLAEFLETLITALPDAIAAEVGDDVDRINPRWGQHAAQFVAQRIARHIDELIEREKKLGEFAPS